MKGHIIISMHVPAWHLPALRLTWHAIAACQLAYDCYCGKTWKALTANQQWCLQPPKEVEMKRLSGAPHTIQPQRQLLTPSNLNKQACHFQGANGQEVSSDCSALSSV